MTVPTPLRIVDSHVHFIHPQRMDEVLALLDAVPCAAFNLVCLPNRAGEAENAPALAFKRRFPARAYVSAALDYRALLDAASDEASPHSPRTPLPGHPSPAPPADLGRFTAAANDLQAQALSLRARGFDGLKLIEGKPEVRKLLPFPLDDPFYAPMWAAVEREGLPVVLHLGDPPEFWDVERCPDWARRAGWNYSDGTYPSPADLSAELDHILARYSRLKVILAHFGFLSHDLPAAAALLDRRPALHFDLAPHLGMYTDFSRDSAAAHDFFTTYRRRIIYGTDLDTRVLERGPEGQALMRFIPWLIRSMLERADRFVTRDGTTYQGLALPREVLADIYRDNFVALYGQRPVEMRKV